MRETACAKLDVSTNQCWVFHSRARRRNKGTHTIEELRVHKEMHGDHKTENNKQQQKMMTPAQQAPCPQEIHDGALLRVFHLSPSLQQPKAIRHRIIPYGYKTISMKIIW